MRSRFFLLCIAVASISAADTSKPQPAYSAISVVTLEGKTMRMHVYSDGVRTKMVDEDGKGGSYTDDSLNTRWQWGPSYGCIHLPAKASGNDKSTRHEETLGTETIEGHPTRKLKVTSTWTDDKGKVTTYTDTIWRATDLGDLIIRTSSDKRQMHLEKLVVGKPDASLLAFPSPPCNASEAASIATARPQAAGGSRAIRFDQGACELIVPLPIAMSIPSDYTVRSVRPLGCFWGAEDDLTRMLSNGREADFTSIRRGIFWCRPSESVEYNPVTHRFVSEAGTDDRWAAAYRGMGAKNVFVLSKPVGVFPSARVTMTASGQRVYMLYLAIPNTESLAILINYRPAGPGGAADDAVWKSFVDSVQEVKK